MEKESETNRVPSGGQWQSFSYSARILVWVFGVLAAWIYVSIGNKSLAPVPSDVAAVIDTLTTGKVVQKFGEKPADDGGSSDLIKP